MNFKEIEEKWQKKWQEIPELYRAYDSEEEFEKAKGFKSRGKKYVLVEFPYPSGSGLHVGHAFSYIATDVYARFLRLMGFNVLCPMGWDAFGLPTENFAIKTKQKPQKVTLDNTQQFKKEMDRLSIGFDWSRQLSTTDPNYYRWTQWIFIKLWEKGLALRQLMPINWCPSCKIGLANEEVVDGKCERCGTSVEKRDIAQWVVKITKYADRLAEGLKNTDFIEKVKSAQVNWIGKKEGARIKFELVADFQKMGSLDFVEVFTTRPDTLFGVSALVVAPEHALVLELLKTNADVVSKLMEYVDRIRNKSDLERTDLNKDKSGVFTGLYSINPISGEKVPIWVADYVLNSFGTGAIMLVPAHDLRDAEFAKKYGLEFKKVIEGEGKIYEGEGRLINSGEFSGLESKKAGRKIINWLFEKGQGVKETTYHLRDWIFSRQHYWGEPMPMYIPEGKEEYFPVPETDLPVKLPEVDNYEPSNTGESPLANISEYCQYVNPITGEKGRRDTDTMPNWAGSDWYYLGYLMPEVTYGAKEMGKGENVFLKNWEKLKYWMPVDVYIGGDEHNTLHMLYSRFIYQFLADLKMVPTAEPYQKRLSHGVILGPDGSRMSKSRGNVIVPGEIEDKYGVDVLRTYMMFMGPFESTMAWNEKTLVGVKRFLERMWLFVENQWEKATSEGDKELEAVINRTVVGVEEDLNSFKFNTPVAKLMSMLNKITSSKTVRVSDKDLEKIAIMLSVYAPYMAEEIWEKLKRKGSVHQASWPVVDKSKLNRETVTVPVCINGKVKAQLLVAENLMDNQTELEKQVLELEVIKNKIAGKKILKIVYVRGKMLNLVVV